MFVLEADSAAFQFLRPKSRGKNFATHALLREPCKRSDVDLFSCILSHFDKHPSPELLFAGIFESYRTFASRGAYKHAHYG